MITPAALDAIRAGNPLHDDESECTLWFSQKRNRFVITGRGNSFVIPRTSFDGIRRHVRKFAGV